MFKRLIGFSIILLCFWVYEVNAQSSEIKRINEMYSFAVVGINKCADPDKAMPIFNEMLSYQETQFPNTFNGFCGAYDNGSAGCVILHKSRKTFDAIQEWQANDDKWLEFASQAWDYCEIDNFAFKQERLERK